MRWFTCFLALGWAISSMSPACQEVAAPRGNHAVKAAFDEAKQGNEGDILKVIEAFFRAGEVNSQAYKKAVAALKGIGRDAVPPLVRLLTTSKDEDTRVAAALALGELGTDAKAAIPALFQIVKNHKAPPRLRGYTWYALRATKPDWVAEMPFLIDALNKGGGFVILEVLEELGPAAKPAIPALIEQVKEDYSSYPMYILGNLGPAAKDAIPVLINGLRSAYHDHQRQAAAEALGKIGPQIKEVVPALAQALRDRHWWVREAAAQALGRIGPAAKEALPALTKTLRDEQREVRTAASDAIQKIKGKPGHCQNR